MIKKVKLKTLVLGGIMSELIEEEYSLLNDVALEFDSALNLLEAWSEKNCILEVNLIVERLKPKVKAFKDFAQKL